MDNLEFLSIVLIQHGNYFSRGYEIPLKKNKGRTLFGFVYFLLHLHTTITILLSPTTSTSSLGFTITTEKSIACSFHLCHCQWYVLYFIELNSFFFFFIMFIIVVSQILWSWIFIMLRAMWNDLSRYFSGTIFLGMCFAHVLFNYFIANFL